MPLPDRPIEGAEIATEWGQEIHDRVFAPSGCQVHSSGAGAVSTTPNQLDLSVIDEDPGGFVGSDLVEIPTDRGGLYDVFVRGNSVNGSAGAGFTTRFLLDLNGATISTGIADNEGGTNVTIPVSWTGLLSAGDQLKVYAQRRGGGTNPDVQVNSMVVLRRGAEFGA